MSNIRFVAIRCVFKLQIGLSLLQNSFSAEGDPTEELTTLPQTH